MPDIPISEILALATDRKWTVLLALLVGTIVRCSKPDVVFPSLPARWRPLLAAALAIVGAGASAVFGGVPLDVAGNAALEAFVLATMGHVLGIDVLRGGREIPMPGLRRPPGGPPSGRGRLDTIHPDGSVTRTRISDLPPPRSAA